MHFEQLESTAEAMIANSRKRSDALGFDDATVFLDADITPREQYSYQFGYRQSLYDLCSELAHLRTPARPSLWHRLRAAFTAWINEWSTDADVYPFL